MHATPPHCASCQLYKKLGMRMLASAMQASVRGKATARFRRQKSIKKNLHVNFHISGWQLGSIDIHIYICVYIYIYNFMNCRRVYVCNMYVCIFICCRKKTWSHFWLNKREFGPLDVSGFSPVAFRPLFIVVSGHEFGTPG